MTIIDKVLAAIIAALLILLAVFAFQKAILRADLAQAGAKNAAYMATNDELADRIKAQNAAIDRLRVESDARAQAAQKEAAEAQKMAKQYAARAAKIARVRPSGDDCATTKKLLDGYFGGVK